MSAEPDPHAPIDELREAFQSWLLEAGADLEPYRSEPVGELAATLDHFRPLQRMLYRAGWSRLGWPEAAGGLGGSPIQRAVVMEALAAAGYVVPELLGNLEIIAPMLLRFAPELASAHLARAIAGEELWCQGFSEPEAGSDLGSLRTRAVEVDSGFRIGGQKMWSSDGHLAQRCALLARTGDPDSGYRGLTMFWVDMDSPGISVRPTVCESGRAEVAELFFDDVEVPRERLVGQVGEGWRVVMYLMQFERGAYGWHRQAELHSELQKLIAESTDPSPEIVAGAYLAIFALRSQCIGTLTSLATGKDLGPEISVDKLLLGAAEQSVSDAARSLLWPALELDDGDTAAHWRQHWSYSRITSIYGGTAEIQKGDADGP
jgi:alkylation response protein AidB-like acyl-CoA dehydrogenase